MSQKAFLNINVPIPLKTSTKSLHLCSSLPVLRFSRGWGGDSKASYGLHHSQLSLPPLSSLTVWLEKMLLHPLCAPSPWTKRQMMPLHSAGAQQALGRHQLLWTRAATLLQNVHIHSFIHSPIRQWWQDTLWLERAQADPKGPMSLNC